MSNPQVYQFGPPGIGKSDAIARMFRRHWWEFWKPKLPVLRPRFLLVAHLHPDDMKGYLTPEAVQAIVKHANGDDNLGG